MRLALVVVVGLLGCKSGEKSRAAGGGSADPVRAVEPATDVPPEIAKSVEKLAAEEQATAKKAKGTVAITRAWRTDGGPKLPADRMWVLVDVDLGGLALDLDDIELVDVDRKVVSAIGDVRRLDASGNIASMHGAHSAESRFLLGFETERATKRVGLQYWGEMLTGAPAAVADSGPVFAQEKREMVRHFAKSTRHVLVFEDFNIEDAPGSSTRVKFDGGECTLRAVLPVSASLAVVAGPIEVIAPHALWALDMECAKTPTVYEWGGVKRVPEAEPLANVPAATLEALEGRGPGLASISTGGAFAMIAVRGDGAMIAIAPAQEGAIWLVDPEGKELGRITREKGELHGFGFSPDGTRLWGAADAGEVTVWDVAGRKKLANRKLEPEPDMYSKPHLSSDGRWLAVDHPWTKPDDMRVAWSGQVTMLAMPDLAVKSSVKVIDGNEGSIVDIAMSPDGTRIVVCAATREESFLRVYGVPRGEQQVSVKLTSSRAAACAIAANGRILVGTENGQLETYDRAGKRLSTAEANRGGVTTIAVRADGSFLTGGADGAVLEWGRGGGKPVQRYQHRFGVHEIIADGDRIVSKSAYEVAVHVNGKPVITLRGSPDGPGEIAYASGLLAVTEMAIRAKASRMRIWRAPAK